MGWYDNPETTHWIATLEDSLAMTNFTTYLWKGE